MTEAPERERSDHDRYIGTRRRPRVVRTPMTIFFGRLRAAYGVLLLSIPSFAAQRMPRRVRLIVRILGARQILQGVASVRHDDAAGLTCGAIVDTLHGSSMLMLALASSKWRRLAATDAAVATAWAATGFVLSAGRVKADVRRQRDPPRD